MLSNQDAARILGVAEWEVLDTRLDGSGWSALVHDSASHEDSWRHVNTLQVVAAHNSADLKALAEEFDQLAQEKADDAVPDGTAAEVLAWVGDNPERAGAALVVETARDRPRSTLLAALEKLAG